MRRRRGVSIAELMITSGFLLLFLWGSVQLVRFGQLTWFRAYGEGDTRQVLSLAIGRVTPDIRSARRVDLTRSDSTHLAVVLPLFDGSTGRYALPLQDGDWVEFYLSDGTGAIGAPGTILWRAVNGVPDAAWALRGGRPAVDLGGNGLSFAYEPSTDPTSVTVTVAAARWDGTATRTQSVSTEIFLRNNGYQ